MKTFLETLIGSIIARYNLTEMYRKNPSTESLENLIADLLLYHYVGTGAEGKLAQIMSALDKRVKDTVRISGALREVTDESIRTNIIVARGLAMLIYEKLSSRSPYQEKLSTVIAG